MNLDGESIQGILGVMIPIVAIVGGLSFAFASMYMRNRERMEMISRGMDPSKADWSGYDGRRRRSPLRSGLTLLGAGAGLLLAYVVCHVVMPNQSDQDQTIIYAGFIISFIGIGRLLSYMLEKKEPQIPEPPGR